MITPGEINIKILSLTGVFFLVLLFSSCQTEELLERDYPVVTTLAVGNISSHGARFNASLAAGDAAGISEYGFVWRKSIVLNLVLAEKITVQGSPPSGDYFYDIIGSLETSQRYYVRAYIIYGELIIYGNMVSFVTLSDNGMPEKTVSGNSP